MKIAIVGGGVFGLAAAFECSARGHAVTLFESDSIPAAKAASHDVSKALRHSYGEKTGLYAPLVAEAVLAWRALERETSLRLFHPVGFLALSSAFREGTFERESATMLERLGVAHEIVSGRDLPRRFPGFAADGIEAALLDPGGGWLDPDPCLLALRSAAVRRGATIVLHQAIADPTAIESDAVLVTAGPWLSKLLPRLEPGIAPTLQHEWFFRARRSAAARPSIPCVWSCDIATLGFYGFPALPDGRHKVASHLHGSRSDPDAERLPDEADRRRTEEFVAGRLPGLDPSTADHRGCFYANTLDGHFLFAKAPFADRLFVAGGGSGHAFKFGPLLGRFAADLVEGRALPREFGLERNAGRTV